MAARTIEAKAIFSATDRTGNVFSFVAKKIESVDHAAKTAQSRIEAFNRSTAANARAGIFRRAEKAVEVSAAATGVHHLVSTAATAVATGVAAHEIISAGARQLHERVRMEAAGMSQKEIAEATALAAKLSGEFKSVDQTETMHMLRNARAIVGSYQEAAEIMEPLMKLRVIAQANRPGQDVSEDFDKLVKGLEIKGVTQHPEQFREYMEGIAKGLNVFGDTLKPYQYYEMFKYGRQATPGLSADFILGTAPTLAQELGGQSYGNAIAGFNRAIVNGRMEHPSIKEMVRLGLLGHDDVDWLKTGEAKGIKPGHAIHGWELAQSDPNEWVKQYLLPAFEKMGVSGADAMMREVGVLFSNKVAAQMVDLLATQQSRIEKDRAMLHNAPGTSAAERYQREDYSIAVQGFKAQLHSAEAAIGAPIAGALTPIVNEAASALAAFSRRVQENTVAQSQGERSEHQKLVQRAFNKVLFDVDSDQPYVDIPDKAWRDRDLRNKREELRQKSSPQEAERIRALRQQYDNDAAAHPWAVKLGFRANPQVMDRQLDKQLADVDGYRRQLQELDKATLRRMVAEMLVADNAEKLNATRPLVKRLDRHVPATVPGQEAMPLSIGYGGVNKETMTIGNHPKPAVAMPTTPPRVTIPPPPPQKVQVGFDVVKVESTVKVDAASALLNVVADAKRSVASAKAFEKSAPHADTAPGGLGETHTGQ